MQGNVLGRRLVLASVIAAFAIGIIYFRPRSTRNDAFEPVNRDGWVRSFATSGRAPQLAPSSDAQVRQFSLLARQTVHSDKSAALRFDVQGLWNVSGLSADRTRFRVQLSRPALRVSSGNKLAPASATRALRHHLSRPFVVNLAANGRVDSLDFPREMSPAARRVLKSIIATTQLSGDRAASDAWRAIELDLSGEYEAEYQRDAAGNVRKRHGRYLRVPAAGNRLSPQNAASLSPKGDTRFELDASGVPTAVHSVTSLVIRPGAGIAAFHTKAELELTWLGDKHAPAFSAGVDHDLEREALYDTTSTAEQRDADTQLVAGATTGQLIALLARTDANERDARARLMTRLAAKLRLDPGGADELATQALARPEDGAILIAALAAAKTPAARAALLELSSPGNANAELRGHAIALLGLSETVDEATLRTLQSYARESAGALRSTALLALGNALRTADPSAATTAAEALVNQCSSERRTVELVLCLKALGNSGNEEALPLIGEALTSTSARVRSAAVEALRFIPSHNAVELIRRTMTTDLSMEVRRSAVFACTFRELTPLAETLAAQLSSEPAPNVRREIVLLLGRRRADFAAATPLLERAATLDADPDVRATASRLLR